MEKSLNSILFKNLSRFAFPESPELEQHINLNSVAMVLSANRNLASYGYSLSLDALKSLMAFSPIQVTSIYSDLISVIKEYKGQSKSQLYRKIIDWIISMSSDAKSAIQVSNEEEGTIIARCYLPNIAKRTMGDNSYRVSIRPLIKFDFKEERIRMTYTLQNYEVLKINDDSGYVIMFGGGFGVTGNGITKDTQIWALSDCYPFAKDIQHPKVTSSRAFVYSLSCYKILVDKIDTVLKKPLQTSDDDW